MKKLFMFILFGLFLAAPVFAEGEDDATVLYNKGIDLYDQNKVEESIETFKKAIAINPEFYEAYYNLARIQEAEGKTKDAIISYEALLKIAPKDYESTYHFGEYLYKKGYLAKSVSYLEKIPEGNEFKAKADAILPTIKRRQLEVAAETKIKNEQSQRSSLIGNIPAPSGLVVDSEGNMYVASFSESKIIKISKDGASKVVFADKTKELNGPIGVAIDSYDNIYVANYLKGDVVLFNKNAEPRILMYVKKPYGVSLNEKNAKIYITEQQGNSIISYDISEILKNSSEGGKKNQKKQEGEKLNENRVMTYPVKDRNPIGVPSIQEAAFTKTSPTASITSPIMVPSGSIF